MKQQELIDILQTISYHLKQNYNALKERDEFNQIANDSYYLSPEQKDLEYQMDRASADIKAVERVGSLIATCTENSFLELTR